MTFDPSPRAVPTEPAPRTSPTVPELHIDDLDGRPLVKVEGLPGLYEWLLPEASAALEAGALVVWLPALPGWPRPLRVRLRRWNGPAWYGKEWQGRGEWYASAHVPAAVPCSGRRTINVSLGTWRPPGVQGRAANAKTFPPPLSPEGVRRAAELVVARIQAQTGGPVDGPRP